MPQSTGDNIFISYSHEDKDWLDRLKKKLAPALRDKVEMSPWDDTEIAAGSEWADEIKAALASAKVAVLLVTPNFLNSDFISNHELPHILAAAGEKKLTLLWVYVKDCKYQGTNFAKYQAAYPTAKPLDLLSRYSRARALTSICDKIAAAALKVGGPPASAVLPPIFKLPFDPNPHFTGRGDALADLRAALTSDPRAPRRAAVTGMGGVGKTQLAVEYAYAHMREYKLIWWLRAENAATLAGDYAELAAKLKLPEAEAAEQRVRVEAVKDWLGRNKGWLLIFDNAPGPAQVSDFLPQGSTGHVIFTSRNPLLKNVARLLPVAELARAESVEFLLKRTGQTDGAAATDLAAALGDLPLALEQAGAYIEESRLGLSTYLGRFLANQKALLERASEAASYPASVASTLSLSLEEVQKESPAGVDLINLCAFLAPTAIPRPIIGADAHPQHLEGLPDSFAGVVGADLPLDDAARDLRRYSLAELRDESLSVHRLTQAVVRDRLPQAEKVRWAKIAFGVINCAFPQDHSDVGQWPTYAALLPHALAVTGHALDYGILSYALAKLMKDAADYLMERAEYARAVELMERALEVIEKLYGADSPEATPLLNGLGNAARELGDLGKSREYLERALRIGELAHGADSPELAVTLHNLGSILMGLGKFEEARPLLERAAPMEVDQNKPGELVKTLGALAWVEFQTGDIEAAEEWSRGVLECAKLVYPPGHPGLGEPLNNLAVVLTKAGKREEALSLLEEVLAINEEAYGPEHPVVSTIHNNLGRLAQESGDLARARKHIETALAIRESQPRPNPLDVALVLNNLGQLLVEAGDLAAGREYFGRALRMHVEHAGEDHPVSQTIRGNYALVDPDEHLRRGRELYEQGNYAGALSAFDEAVRLGPDDGRIRHWRGAARFKLGQYTFAQDQFEGALADFMAAEGMGAGDALNDKFIGLANYKLRNYTEAVEYLTRAIERSPGDAVLYHIRGVCRGDQGDFAAALPDFEKAVELEPEDSEYLDYLGQTRQRLGDFRGALAALSKAIHLSETVRPMPYSNSRYRLTRARVLWLSGDVEGALRAFDEILDRNPNAPEARRERGLGRFMLGQWQGAVTDFSYILRRQPRDGEACKLRGQAHYVLGRYEEARADLERASALMPDDLTIRIQLARCHLNIGAYDEAAKVLDSDLGSHPDRPFALFWRGVAQRLCGRPAEAEAAFGRALLLAVSREGRPEEDERAQLRGRIYLLTGREDESRIHYARAAARPNSKSRLLGEIEHLTLLSRLFPSEQSIVDVKDWLGTLSEGAS